MDSRNTPPAVEQHEYEDPPRDVQRRWNWDMTWVVGLVAAIFVIVIIAFVVFE
jgi:hypothetical protein